MTLRRENSLWVSIAKMTFLLWLQRHLPATAHFKAWNRLRMGHSETTLTKYFLILSSGFREYLHHDDIKMFSIFGAIEKPIGSQFEYTSNHEFELSKLWNHHNVTIDNFRTILVVNVVFEWPLSCMKIICCVSEIQVYHLLCRQANNFLKIVQAILNEIVALFLHTIQLILILFIHFIHQIVFVTIYTQISQCTEIQW